MSAHDVGGPATLSSRLTEARWSARWAWFLLGEMPKNVATSSVSAVKRRRSVAQELDEIRARVAGDVPHTQVWIFSLLVVCFDVLER